MVAKNHAENYRKRLHDAAALSRKARELRKEVRTPVCKNKAGEKIILSVDEDSVRISEGTATYTVLYLADAEAKKLAHEILALFGEE